jgi:DNA processing protein
VLEELRFDVSLAPAAPSREEEGISPAGGLLKAMGYDPASLDALCARTGHPVAILQAQLLELELAGHVARMPGGLFQRITQG